MKFVDYKCNDCETVTEYYVKNDNSDLIKCPSCQSSNMIRIFAPVKCRCNNSDGSSSSKSCSGGSCSSCSGCH